MNPTIATEFSTAAYRFAHSTLPPTFKLHNGRFEVGQISLAEAFFNPEFLADNPGNIDLLFQGFARQRAQEVDNFLVEEVRSFLFGPPGSFDGGLDLAALNIQRGRDHGLPPYNMIRDMFGLEPVSGFDQISSDTETQSALESVYGSVDEIDAWVGGLAEDHLPGASVGELVAAVLVYQFTALRDGDRFFYLNDPDLQSEVVRKVGRLEGVSLSSIVTRNTGVRGLRKNLFFVGKSDAIAFEFVPDRAKAIPLKQ